MAENGSSLAVVENEARNATAISLVEDTYFYYLSEGITVDPLENDSLPSGSKISSANPNFNSFVDVDLKVEGPDGSSLGSARINTVGFDGIPGIGGYTTSKTAEDAFEDIGTLTVDLEDYLASSTTPMGDILSVDALMTNPNHELDVRLTGIFVSTASNGIMRGGDGNDIVATRNDVYDVLIGGEGKDEFRFGDYADGNGDHNVIMDFEPSIDTVVFTGSRVTIEKYSEIMDGIIIETVQGDSLTILGDGVSADTFIGTTAMENYTIQEDILQGIDPSNLSLEFLWATQYLLF